MSRNVRLLAYLAFAILAGAAVWMGGLNQDEGWYLYAANLVHEGKLPYRDFAYTQGPLLPIVYSAFVGVWERFGLLGARALTASIALAGVFLLATSARLLVPADRRSETGLGVFLLLACNLYHLYYTAIPKTYALAALFVASGFFVLSWAYGYAAPRRGHGALLALAGFLLALAAGARISLGAIAGVVGFALLANFRRFRWDFLLFGLGGLAGLALVYGPFLCDPAARAGLVAAQRYHAARGGFDPVFTVGSLSRLVRWYLPAFVVLGLALADVRRLRETIRGPVAGLAALSFLAVFAVQMLAPFPYEDYQVPVMGLVTLLAAVGYLGVARPETGGGHDRRLLLVLGLAFATAFGSPLLETWKTNGQDRFWTLKKPMSELAQLRQVAREIEHLDPGGKTLLTQDLYLAVETRRKVPRGLEMGPFSILSDAEWKTLLEMDRSAVAALSGYSFAIDPPTCVERPVEKQMEYWHLVKRQYDLAFREEAFGQHATPLLVLKRKP